MSINLLKLKAFLFAVRYADLDVSSRDLGSDTVRCSAYVVYEIEVSDIFDTPTMEKEKIYVIRIIEKYASAFVRWVLKIPNPLYCCKYYC